MQRVVIDTNVIVSALIQFSYPYKIIYQLYFDQRFMLCLSDALLEEYYEVLSRPKFARFTDFFSKAEHLLADIAVKAILFVPEIKLDMMSDKDDNKILELADASGADYIITGNLNDFTFPLYKQAKIVSPKEYWEHYAPM
jgi:uncharacterized protein